VKEYLKRQKQLAREYKERYEAAEIIPITARNYLRILFLIYARRILSLRVMGAVLLGISIWILGLSPFENDPETVFHASLFIVPLTLLFPPLWVLLIFVLAKRKGKYAFRKIDWLSDF